MEFFTNYYIYSAAHFATEGSILFNITIDCFVIEYL